MGKMAAVETGLRSAVMTFEGKARGTRGGSPPLALTAGWFPQHEDETIPALLMVAARGGTEVRS
jgi:hypothetical protein